MPAKGQGTSGFSVSPTKIKQAAARPKPPAPRVFAPPKPPPRLFAEPLHKVTARNLRTGGQMRQLVAEHKLHEPAPKRGILGTVLHGVSQGEQAVEHGLTSVERALHVTPGLYAGRSHPLSPSEADAERRRAALLATQFGTGLGVSAAGRGVLKGADVLGAVRGARVGSAVLKGVGGGTVGYGKLLTMAAPAHAAVEVAPTGVKKHEPFVAKLWKSAAETIANLPAGVIESGKHPIKTLEAMGHLYSHPKQAFQENPFGTALAFLAPTTAVDRLAGAGIRGLSKGKILATERADIQYAPGLTVAREYQPGAVAGTVQRIPETAKALKADKMLKGTGLRKVNGATFKGAVDRARGEDPQAAANLTSHEADHYHAAYLTKDGKAGYALVKTGKKLPDGRPETELVNLFRANGGKQGISDALIRHAIKRGANSLDAFQGKLTEKYGRHGFVVHRSEPNWEPGGPNVLYMHRPNLEIASGKRQIARGVGDKYHGILKPSQVDVLKGGQKLAHNLELMETRHFLHQHFGTDKLRQNVIMAFHQGEVRRPDTFWEDVAERQAHLKEAAHDLSHNALRQNKLQQEKLLELERNRPKIDDALLKDAADAAGHIGTRGRILWEHANENGIGHPQQLNARNLPAVLMHGHLMGRGDLRYIAEPGDHPLKATLKDVTGKYEKTMGQIRTLNAELRGARLSKGHRSGRHFEIERLRRQATFLREHRNELREKLTIAKYKGLADPQGRIYPGVFDAQGKRVEAPDIQRFLNEHFEGREMGFLSHKQERLAAEQTGGHFLPRTIFPMRTGETFLNGAYDNTPAALVQHFDRITHSIAEMRSNRQVAGKLALGKVTPEGEHVWYDGQKEAELAAEKKNVEAGGELVQNHLGPWVAYKVGPHKVAEGVEPNPLGQQLAQLGHVEHQALNEDAGAWGIMPEKIANRLNEWADAERKISTSRLRMITNPWRHTNLYTSVRWPFGTTQENAIRMASARTSPLVVLPYGKHTSINFGTGSHVIKFLDEKIHDPNVPEVQKEMALFHRSMYGTGNFVGSQLMQDLEPAQKILGEDTKLQRGFQSFPGTKAWNGYKHFVGNSLSKMETNAKTAAGGRLARDDAGFFKTWNKALREQSAKDYVDKVTSDPAKSIHEAEKLMDIVGNWNHLTPMTRNAQATWAPFSLWWLNSARFIFKTMPKDHPYATGLLAAMVTATGAANRDLKSYLTGTVPLDLPLLGKINLNPVHYSPYDIAHEPLETAGSMILPQITEPVMESAGIDPLTGDKYEGGEGYGAVHIGESLFGSFVPGARIGMSISRRAGKVQKDKLFPWQTKEPLGVGKALAKTFAPFMFTYDRTPPVETPGSVSEKPRREAVKRERITRERVHR